MKRHAFTMIELIIVIVIIGLLAALTLPNYKTDPLREAAEQVANHIRYTQHLAMVDDKYDDTNSTWYKEKWQLRFYSKAAGGVLNYYYTVFTDDNQQRNVDIAAGDDEVAIDPLSGKGLNAFYNNDSMNLTDSYGITNVNTSCFIDDNTLVATNRGCLGFDNLGRPYRGTADATSPTQYLLTTDCNVTLTRSGKTAVITVRPETGYVSVTYP